MRHPAYPEYDYEPTLTTSELRALKKQDAEKRAEERRLAEEAEAYCKKSDDGYLLKLHSQIVAKFDEYIANPTKETAEWLIGVIDFYSDVYKDEHCVRPHGAWICMFAQFSQRHNDVWESVELR